MANEPVLGRFQKPQSLAQLTRGRGWNSELVGFLLPMARDSFIYKEFDFLETAITDDPNTDWATDDGGGAASSAFATVANDVNGAITGSSGTDDNKGVALIADAIDLDPAQNPGCHIRVKIDDITEAAIEFGMFDALTDESLVACTDYGDADFTIGNGLDMGVFVGYDGDTTTQNGFSLITEGATDGAEGVAIGAAATEGDPMAAGVYSDVVVQAFSNAGYAIMEHNRQLAQGLSVGPDAAQLMRYRFAFMTRAAATAKIAIIDLIRTWRERV